MGAGPLAQSEERRTRIAEVVGSNPIRSTNVHETKTLQHKDRSQSVPNPLTAPPHDASNTKLNEHSTPFAPRSLLLDKSQPAPNSSIGAPFTNCENLHTPWSTATLPRRPASALLAHRSLKENHRFITMTITASQTNAPRRSHLYRKPTTGYILPHMTVFNSTQAPTASKDKVQYELLPESFSETQITRGMEPIPSSTKRSRRRVTVTSERPYRVAFQVLYPDLPNA